MRRYPGPAELLWTLLILSPACGGGEPGSGLAPDNRTPDVALDAPGPDAGLDAEQDTPGDPGTDTTPETGVEAGGDAVVYPDPAFIHMVGGPALASAQDPWTTDEPVQLRTAEVLGDLDVRCLSAAGDRVWAGTATGLFRWDEEAGGFEEIPLVEGTGPVVDLSERLDGWGRLVLLRAHRVIWMDPDSGVQVSAQVPDQDLTALTVAGGWTWVGTANHGIWGAPPGPGLDGTVVLAGSGGAGPVVDLAGTEAGGIHAVTAAAYRSWSSKDAEPVEIAGFPEGPLSAVATGDPFPWVAGSWGIARVDGPAELHVLAPGIGGLPLGEVTALAPAGDRILLGHAVGATLLEDPLAGLTGVHHWAGGRWLPSDDVRDVVLDAQGRPWVGTAAGITRVDWVEHTFAEKALHHEALQDAHFWRLDGFVPSDVGSDDAWNPVAWTTWDHDNDGLWTQMQIGAWCYGYAANGDTALYQKARRALNLMELQVDIPAVDFEAAGRGRGFVTRSLVRDDEPALFAEKATQPNWHLVSWTDGHDYYWKDDTSSDEITGHFYGYPLYHDLCAKDDAERAEVAAYAADIAGYILDCGFQLLDLDGIKTTHGHWAPEQIGTAALGIDACMEAAGLSADPVAAVALCFESWMGGGWLNSVEILGVLLSTWHMTGDARFYDAYETLVTEHRYDLLATPHEETVTIVEPSMMNHSDHELAMLAYQTLIRYEPDDTRRERWIDGLLFLLDHEREERNPLWNAYVALAAGIEWADMEDALQSLMEMPFDLRTWPVDNSHRQDAGDWPDDRFGDPQFDRVFPYDEIRTVWWNGNLYAKVEGGSPKNWQGPLNWLLPYYAMRYAGVISD